LVTSFSSDIVDLVREGFELKKGFSVAMSCKREQQPLIVIFDGSLVFWHLESKPSDIKEYFFSLYTTCLERFYEERIPIVGYISLPKSGELVSYIKFFLDELSPYELESLSACSGFCREKDLEYVIDSYLGSFFLKPLERTGIFRSSSSSVMNYSAQIIPHFFYLHVGHEIVRVEIPAWITQDIAVLNTICGIIVDQCKKGRGYPVSLSEAHEQSVVKGSDRDFFYHLIYKFGYEQQKRMFISQKSLKKRGIGI